MRSLILNADDFGWSLRTNRAIEHAHRHGVLTSASLMVAEAGFADAVEVARGNPALGIGLHLAVTYDKSLLGSGMLPSITGADGAFSKNPLLAGLRYQFSGPARRELSAEIDAQFERFASTGIPWSHADGHQHFHMHPAVWACFLQNCIRHRVNRVRIPCEPAAPHRTSRMRVPLMNSAPAAILRIFARRNRRALERAAWPAGLRPFVVDAVYGQYATGMMHPDYVLRLLPHITGETCEMYFHPGTDHAMQLADSHRSTLVVDTDHAALVDPRVRSAIEAAGLEPVTYAEAERRRAERA